AFDAAVARAVQAVGAPAGLRDRLLADAMARRGAEWRRTLARSATALGIAVVGLGGCWSGSLYFLRPDFNPDAPAGPFADEQETPDGAVRAWLAREGLPPDLPPELDFDFRLRPDRGYADLDGRKVPRLLFTVSLPGAGRSDTAELFVLRGWQFDTR